MLLATREPEYNEFVSRHQHDLMHWSDQGMRWWSYLMCDASIVDKILQAELRRRLLGAADQVVAATDQAAYRMGNGRSTARGWGACQGANYGIGPPLESYPAETADKAKGVSSKGWPLWRSWRDVWDHSAEVYSEFTVPQTCGPAAMLYAALYALG